MDDKTTALIRHESAMGMANINVLTTKQIILKVITEKRLFSISF